MIKTKQKTWFSKSLGQEIALNIYGSGGKPVLIFPTRGGRFFDFENFGMIDSCKSMIEDGKFQFFTVDSIDKQSWLNTDIKPEERALRHEDYDHYILDEVLPFIQKESKHDGKIITAGCDMGGYHAANFFFRHPEYFDTMISLSGFFHLQMFIGDFVDELVYYNSPLYYLPNLTDNDILDQFRKGKIIICVGQGEWERPMIANAYALKRVLQEKEIPCWVDFWGFDVNHDWIWWRKQLPYFLEKLEQ